MTAPRGTSIDLDGLFDVGWPELSHAHGSAADVPGLIEALALRRHGDPRKLATLVATVVCLEARSVDDCLEDCR